MSRSEDASSGSPREVVDRWTDLFVEFVNTRKAELTQELFAPHGSWRDLLALTWELRSAIGHERIADFATAHVRRSIENLTVLDTPPPELIDFGPDLQWIQGFFTFETTDALAHGMVRLVSDGAGGWKAWTAVTDMLELRSEPARPSWSDIADPSFNQPVKDYRNWADRRLDTDDTSPAPTVLVIGGGQCGLHIAARLAHLGVETLVIERTKRVGDAWRERHYNLRTHTPVVADQFPFLPYPASWPMSIEKDQLASWCEFYATALELNVSTETEFVDAAFDEAAGAWTVHVRRGSGEVETIRPRHLVLATGLLSRPRIPTLRGADSFTGTVLHSSEYRSAKRFEGQRVVVVGAGASGHDIAQDVCEQGGDVTIVQRSPTYVMSFEHGISTAYSSSYDYGVDLEVSDLMFKSFPLPVMVGVNRAASPMIAEADKALLDGLRDVGFRLREDVGMLELAYTASVGGYYINQGASDLIIDGSIGLKAGEVTGFDANSVLFSDGSTLEADVVVLCTGYHNMRESVRELLGDTVARGLPEVWVIDHERGGEHSALWTDTGYPNFWIQAGALQHSRVYSKHLALKIAALEAGIIAPPGEGARR